MSQRLLPKRLHLPLTVRRFSLIGGHHTDNMTIDVTVLNFPMKLEHLENAIYPDALANSDNKAFTDADLPSFFHSFR